MQSERMQVQLCPQLTDIQAQLKTAIANHQMVFGRYQKDPENAVLRDKLEEMQLQIKNLSNHQRVLVQQLRGELIQNASTAVTISTVSTIGSTTTPVVVTPASVARPLGPLSPRPQLLALQPHTNLGIVLPLAHLQAQPTLMTIPSLLSQPKSTAAQCPPVVSLQLNASSAATVAAILTQPTLVSAVSTGITIPKQGHPNPKPLSANTLKLNQSVLQPIQPCRAEPPIKVPQYTVSHHANSQGQQGHWVKGSEKSNGVIHRSFSESDAKELKKTLDHSVKDVRKAVENRNFCPAEKRKQEFMARIGLVTHDALKELQCRRVERKRRSTANPHYSYTLDIEKRRNNGNSNANSWLLGGWSATKRPKGRVFKASPSPNSSDPATPDSQDVDEHSEAKQEVCAECGKGGQLLLCGTCSLVYHLDCLSPPLLSAPASPWSCPACIVSGRGVGTLSNGALSMVNSYIAARANKEDERRKLQRKNTDLLAEKQSLQEKSKNLKQQIEEKRTRCDKLTEAVEEKSTAVETLNAFVKSFQDPVPPAGST